MKLLATILLVIIGQSGFQSVYGQVLDVNILGNVSLEMELLSAEVADHAPDRTAFNILEADEEDLSRVDDPNANIGSRSGYFEKTSTKVPALSLPLPQLRKAGEVEGWKAGVSKINITPRQPMWMAGYGGRTSPSEGTLHPIWVKVLALADRQGNQAVLITSDLLGWPKGLSDQIRAEVKDKYGLEKARIILNSSHTHTGPVLKDALYDIYPLDDEERKKIEAYSAKLKDRVVALIGESLDDMESVRLFSGNGVARFQVNRRNNDEATQRRITDLNGPNDYAVPVIKVEKTDGSLMAIVFGYACHPTVLSFNKWSGDYPGFAQIELEKEHPGTQAMFFQGAGADQNPIPRRTVPLARQYGRTLAAAVDRVLEEEMNPLEPKLETAYAEVELDLNSPPSIDELTHFCGAATSYQKRWGERLLGEAKAGKEFRESYPFPLQVWTLGDQNIFTLGGETLIGYAIQLKEIFGYDSFVMGYSNDVMTYIPTARVLHEGGYEGATAQMVYGLPARWAFDIESAIVHGIVDLAKSIKVMPPESKLISK